MIILATIVIILLIATLIPFIHGEIEFRRWIKGLEGKTLSDCCGMPTNVAGDTTKYYVCSECKKPCDLRRNK